jgi:predicted transposase/invertase (TIGR01784 family)
LRGRPRRLNWALSTGDYYETICPTYSLCFIEKPMFSDSHYHHAFRLADSEHGQIFSNDLQIHVLELDKFDLPVEQIQTPLERWCFFLRHGSTLDSELLPTQLDVPLISQAMEVLMALSRDERERFRIRDRIQGLADAANFRQEALHAREKGREEGEWIGRIHAFQKLLHQPLTPSTELAELSLDELMRLAEELEQHLSGALRQDGAGGDKPAVP